MVLIDVEQLVRKPERVRSIRMATTGTPCSLVRMAAKADGTIRSLPQTFPAATVARLATASRSRYRVEMGLTSYIIAAALI